MRLFAVCALTLLMLAPAAAEPLATGSREGGPRVRPKDERVASLLLDGMRRSATVRALVERIEASNVIVYIEHQPALSKRLQGSLQFQVATGGYRYVRAAISPGLGGDASVAAIAHELQHVVEIAESPSVVDQASLMDLYMRIGHEIRSVELGFDTRVARDVGASVRRELRDRAAGPAFADETPLPTLEQLLSWQRRRPSR